METSELLVRALGPVTVSRGSREIPLSKAQVRTALAVLLTHLGQVVSVDVLVDAIWNGCPPRSGRHGLHVIASELRTSLEAGTDREHLVSQPPGYRLTLAEDEFDVSIVSGLAADARACIDDHALEEAEALLIAAEAMWHGPPYAEFTYADFAQREIRRLTELHLQVIEDRIGIQLDLGRHRDVIVELEGLVAGHPTRERLLRSLMEALYRSNRPVEALSAFNRARERLRSEYGTEPSVATVRLEEAIRTVRGPRIPPLLPSPNCPQPMRGGVELVANPGRRSMGLGG
jgi:DNA-binding SARP family transcriptional activator